MTKAKSNQLSAGMSDPAAALTIEQFQQLWGATTRWNAEYARQLLSRSETLLLGRLAVFTLRLRLELTQEQFAERLGVSLRSVSRYEAGGEPVSLPILSKMIKLADETNAADVGGAFRHIYKQMFTRRMGQEQEALVARNDLEQLRLLMRSVVELWSVYTGAEERVRARLDDLLRQMSELLLPAEQKQEKE